jgi:peptidoglycan/xylan/chitin deacetylase (PgdA/CDA1 family)
MAAILMYHRITGGTGFDPWSLRVSPARFSDHLDLLRKKFEVVSLQDLCACHRAGRIPARAVCVTFDDGYYDNLATAKPLLEQAQLPATVFVATGFLGSPGFWWDRLTALFGRIAAEGIDADRVAAVLGLAAPLTLQHVWALVRDLPPARRDAVLARLSEFVPIGDADDDRGRPMTETEASRLAGSLLSIGAHTVSHPWLPALDGTQIRHELSDSMRRCEEIAGVPVRTVAYPYGAFDPVVVEGAASAGVECAVTTQPGSVTSDVSLLALPRLKVTDCRAADLEHALSPLCGGA